MNYIINLSPKKTGTSTVYHLFRKNFPAFSQKELFIPPVKEYYLLPRRTKLFFNLDLKIKGLINEEVHKICDLEKKFLFNIASESTQEKLNLLFLTERAKNYKLLTRLCFDRLEKMYEKIDHRQCFLNDNNFFEDFISIFPQDSFADFLKMLDKNGKNRFFAFYRNPIDTVISLARMLYHDTGWDPYSKEHSVLTWVQINFVRTCLLHNLRYSLLKHTNAEICIFDFSYFMNNQEEFISLFCEKFDIKKPNKIEVVGNVNPKASWLKKNKYWDKNIEKKLRNYLLRHLEFSEELKLEISLHEMISKTRFAMLDSSTFRSITLEKSKYLN